MERTNECLVDRMDRGAKTTMKGILIYAFNNDRIDYFRQAVWCADRVNRYLNLPVTIVTDKTSYRRRTVTHSIVLTDAQSGGKRVFNPSISNQADIWYNGNRFQSFDISPYEQTIVIDSDYVVCSDQLLTLFDCNLKVTAMKHVYDVTDRDGFKPYRSISDSRGLHHYWATVLYFDRSKLAQDFFIMMDMIKKHYAHYSNIYRFPTTPFRNDFAASIALNTIYGHVPDAVPVIPWRMANVFNDVGIRTTDQETFELTYNVDANKTAKKILMKGQDFHFMNKFDLAKLYEN
jgi:hypothetical protein